MVREWRSGGIDADGNVRCCLRFLYRDNDGELKPKRAPGDLDLTTIS